MFQSVGQWLTEPTDFYILISIVIALTIGIIIGRLMRPEKDERSTVFSYEGEQAF